LLRLYHHLPPPQCLQQSFLGGGHAGDIHLFIRSLSPKRFQTLAGLHIPELARFTFTATG
jgi:hypothetical protein